MRNQSFFSGKAVGGWLASAAIAMSIATVTHASTTIDGVGSPPTSVDVNRYYGFQSWASDTDGRSVTYAIKNKPSWATFDTTYGHLYGIPPTSAAGTYSNIVISASDGVSQASLAPFTIVVVGSGGSSSGSGSSGGTSGGGSSSSPGSATLSWQPPTANTNGSSITNLAGYTIYYGTNSNSYTSVKVANPGLTSYTISNLAAGTYGFAVVAYNSAGEASQYSATVSKVVK
jgi:Putative Ig domain/Fibronectin type III domain